MLKCNDLIAPSNAVWFTKALPAANTGISYLVKAAMASSKSPKTIPQKAVGYLRNLMRLLNTIHPPVPIALILALFVPLGWGWSAL